MAWVKQSREAEENSSNWNINELISYCFFKEYQQYFQKSKDKVEKSSSEKQIGADSFGKLKTFTQRLNKILEMFSTISTYSVLENSKLEGLETMATGFQVNLSEAWEVL